MEREDTPISAIDLQTAPVADTRTDIYNTPENSNIKEEPEFHGNGDAVKFSEHVTYGGNVTNIINIKTELIDIDDYHSGDMNNTHGPAHSDSNARDQIPATSVTYINPEPEYETHTTSEFVIEIDTCKDEYYEMYGYPTNCVDVNLQNSEQNGGRSLCAIDTEPCSVGLTDIRNTYPDIITGRSVQIHDAGLISVIDEQSEVPATNVMMHADANTISKTHIYQVCGAAFPGKSNLNSHALIHTGLKPHKCPGCGDGFAQKGNLTTHMRMHTGEKLHKCSVCEVRFTMKHHLASHMRTHTGEKPYKCTVCGVGFRDNSNRTNHMRIHTEEKPHTCYVCKRSFRHKSNLTCHMRTHTGDKPYKCSVCGVGFTRRDTLKTHMRIHTGEKPHACSVCEVSFAYRHSMTRHKRRHGGEKPNKSTAA